MNKKTTRFPLTVKLNFTYSIGLKILLPIYILFIAAGASHAQVVGCSGTLGKPLVTIDFGKGKGMVSQDQVTPKPNISSAYKFVNTPNSMTDGTYCISNRSDLWYTDWHKGIDHTPNDDSLGRMLVVNAAIAAGEFCRIRVDDLCANTKFEFSAFVANVQRPWPFNGCGPGGEIPINIKFQIEDLAGNIIASENTGDIRLDTTRLMWQKKAFMFDTKNNTSIQLVLKNNGKGGCGNDLAIDDISFAPCGPNLTIDPVASCSESDFTISVNGATTVYPNPVYLWEYSTDKGVSWNAVPNGDKASIVGNHKNDSTISTTVLYRVYAAGDATSVRNPRCRVESPVQEVTIYPTPRPKFKKSTPFCIGGPVYFEVDPNNSTTDKYVWTFKDGDPSTSTDAKVTVKWPNAGTYPVSLVVTDVHGCKNKPTSATQDVVINGRPPVTISPSSTALYCKDKSVELTATATAGYKHQWKKDNVDISGANSATYSASSAGTYQVQIIDANGCTNTASVTVSPADVFKGKVLSLSHVTCHGRKDGEAAITVENKDPNNYTYKWVPNVSSSVNAVNLAPGDYKVYIKDNITHCEDTLLFKITQPPNGISIDPLLLVPVKCHGEATGFAKVKVAGGTAPYNYQWLTSSGTIVHNYDTLSNLIAQEYTVLVTDDKGCTFSNTLEIKQPSAPLSIKDSVRNLICFENDNAYIGVTVKGGTGTYTYSWDTNPVHTQNSINKPKPGKYTVVVKDMNGCTISSTLDIKGPIAPLTDSLRYLKPVICYENKDGIAFVAPKGGTPGYTYEWNTGAKTDTIKNLDAGTYTVVIRDKNNCSLTDVLEVKGPKARLSASITNTTLSCFNDSSASATVSAKGGTPTYTYAWQTNPIQTTATIEKLKVGTYSVIVKDANDCTVGASVTITEPKFPPDEYIISASYCDNDSAIVLHAEKGYNPYQWFEDGKPVKGAVADTFRTKNYKSKKITVTWWKNGCTHQSSEVVVTEPGEFFLPESTTTIFTPNGDGQADYFYPYSSNYDKNKIDYYAKDYRLQVFDRWGKLMFETTDYNNPWDGTYKTSSANSGVYYWMSTYVSRCGGGSKKVNKGFVHLMK